MNTNEHESFLGLVIHLFPTILAAIRDYSCSFVACATFLEFYGTGVPRT
jgi:hypothetical protein